MSPIVHGMVAWLVAMLFAKQVNDRRLITIAGVVLDIDGIFILFNHSSYVEFHHTFGHSFVFGILVAITACALSVDRVKVFFGALAAFSLHLAADILVTNWSVSVLYPISDYRLAVGQDPFIVAIIYPATFFVCLGLILFIAYRKGFSPIEFVSEKLDRLLISALFPARICTVGSDRSKSSEKEGLQ